MGKNSSAQTQSRGCVAQALAVMLLLGSGIYLLNFSFGIWELPDNLPIVGNVDESVATYIFISCLSFWGIDIVPFKSKMPRSRTPGIGE